MAHRVSKNYPDGWIYVLTELGYCKIGRSKQPIKRASEVITKLPFRVYHLIQTDNVFDSERYLHERFATKRKEGEWFRLDSSDFDWLLSFDCLWWNESEAQG